jgi:hypothetical protein
MFIYIGRLEMLFNVTEIIISVLIENLDKHDLLLS